MFKNSETVCKINIVILSISEESPVFILQSQKMTFASVFDYLQIA
jgi:hypothetical protein